MVCTIIPERNMLDTYFINNEKIKSNLLSLSSNNLQYMKSNWHANSSGKNNKKQNSVAGANDRAA